NLSGGYVALLGESVRNEGVIAARLGTAALAAGNATTLDFNGDQLLNVQVDEGALLALADNRGLIQADGGSVLMTARAKDALLDTAVNNSGVIRARTVENRNGRILLIGDMDSGTANIAGTLDASAPDGGNGGFIETSAAHVKVADNAVITTKAAIGQSGTWLIDPNDFTIAASGGNMTGAAVGNALDNNGNFIIQTATMGTAGGHGDIHVNDVVNWSSNSTLTLQAERSVNVNAAITATGSGAGLVVDYNQGSGVTDGNFYANARVNLPLTGSLAINGQGYTLIDSLAGLNDPNGHYALVQDSSTAITATLGNLTGTLEGLGHRVSDININDASGTNIGLFNTLNNGSLVRNLGIDGNVTGKSNVGLLASLNAGSIVNVRTKGSVQSIAGFFGTAAGGLVGTNTGSITHAAADVTITGVAGATGGLVGNNTGNISNSHATGAVTNDRDSGFAGGLVGDNDGSITRSYATGATTALIGSASVGGLVGINNGSISYAYATGAVTANKFLPWQGNAGGLVGVLANGSNINNVWASGAVTGLYAGGLVGWRTGGITVNAAYWDTDTTGQLSASGFNDLNGAGVGLSMADAFDSTKYTDLNFGLNGDWLMINGQTRPFLASEFSYTIGNAHQLQLMAFDLAGNYRLVRDIDAGETGAFATNPSGMWGSAGFVPVGSNPSTSTIPSLHFQGTLDGQYHLIRNLRIDMSTDLENGTAGLFGSLGNSGVVRRVGLVNPVVKLTGTTNTGVGYYQAGALAGENRGRIEESFALGADIQVFSATADNTQAYAGGLVGWNESGSTVTQSYATGTVAAAGELSSRAGGLVGRNQTGATLSQSWAAATVTATGGWEAAGGVAGINSIGATISNSIWDTSLITTGIGSGAGGVTGLDATQMTGIANFTGWGADISANGGESTVWRIYDGHTAPLLRGFLRQLTVSVPVGGADKTYDGQVASGTFGTYTTSTPTDASLLLGTLGYATTSANAGTYSTANGTLQLGGLHSTQQGYDINYAGASTLTINKAALTVTANNAGKTYDATAWSGGNGVSYSGFVNGENEAMLGGTLAYGGNSQGAVNAGNYLISASGLSSGNYAISYVDGILTIDPRTLGIVVNLTGTVRKTYDGTTNATLDAGNFLITGWAGNDGATITQTSGQYGNANAGSGKNVTVNLTLADYLAANGTDLANYVLPMQVSGNVGIIDKAGATVTANSGTVTYNGQVRNVTGYTVTGLVNGEDESVLDSVVTTGGSGRNAGSYAHTVSGSDNNYNLTFIDGALTINKANATITAISGTTTYNGRTQSVSGYSASGLVNGEDGSVLTGLTETGGSGRNAGSYAHTVSGSDNNYNLTFIDGALTIDKASATVTANSNTVTYNGQTQNASGYSASGLVNGEDESVLTGLTETGGSGRNAGSYAHTVSGSDNNYNLTFIDGVLTIDKATLTLSSNNITKTYDGTTAANGTAVVTDGQLFGSDTISGGHFAYTDKNAGTGKTVTVNGITVSDGNGGNNYDVTYVANITSTILQKTLTIGGSFDAADKLYDGDNRATIGRNALALQGVVAGDALAADWQAMFADASVAPNKTVTLQGTTLAGGDSANYLLVLEGAPTATASISGTPLGAAGGRYASATQSAKNNDTQPARYASSVPAIAVQQCGQNLPAQLVKDCQ
ncbi:MAG: hypothetical protein B7X38_05445, partial [Stenotrophomonas sp. 14-69-23]